MVTNLTCIFCKKALTVGEGADFKNGLAKSENHMVDDIIPVQVDNNREVGNNRVVDSSVSLSLAHSSASSQGLCLLGRTLGRRECS